MKTSIRNLTRWQLICEQRAARLGGCNMDAAAAYWAGKARAVEIILSARYGLLGEKIRRMNDLPR